MTNREPVLAHMTVTQLGAAWFPDVNEWCSVNLGPRCRDLQDHDGRWLTYLRHDHRLHGLRSSPYSIAILTTTAEDHALATLRWG